MNRITEFKFQKGYQVWLKFADGFEGNVDLKPFLGKGIASELLMDQEFKILSIEPGGGLEWHNGYDICPNYLKGLAKDH